jgi:glycine cleavage system aminomethyltransferase T
MDILNLKYYNSWKGKFAGVDNVLVMQQAILGQVVLKFILKIKRVPPTRSGMQSLRSATAVKPIGLGARDTLRLRWRMPVWE